MYSFPTFLSQSARPEGILFQLFRDLALVAPAVSLSNAFRNSRLRFRLSNFFFRLRLNLALSPLLFDINSPSRAQRFSSESSQSGAVASHLRGSAIPRFERFVYMFLGSALCLPHHFRDLADQELSRLLQCPTLAKRERLLLAQSSQRFNALGHVKRRS